mmetsp:Transcript_8851/g.29177  ORF Transcript_8851/g.29177 Transcript_8851/m.29177 type:complete len:112 (+) Transcript_8851:59-394(+)
MERPGDGVRVARPAAIVHAVAPRLGRGLMYYHQVLHAGEPVGRGSTKYCLRTDVMYERRPPICTAPHDVEAYALLLRARELEAAGEPMEAVALYRRIKRLSDGIAAACRLR